MSICQINVRGEWLKTFSFFKIIIIFFNFLSKKFGYIKK